MELVSTRSSAKPPIPSSVMIQSAATASMRRVSEPSRSSRNRSVPGAASLGAGWIVEAVSKSADRVDEIGTELLANACDEHLDGVRVAIKVLVVDMLDQ